MENALEKGASRAEGKGKLGANAMMRVVAGAHLPTSWFISLRNAPIIEPTNASAVVSFPIYSFLQLSGF